jgi:hypothetical protein
VFAFRLRDETIEAETFEIYLNEIGMVTVLGLTIQGLISGRGKKFFSFPKVQNDSGAHPASYSIDTGIISRG